MRNRPNGPRRARRGGACASCRPGAWRSPLLALAAAVAIAGCAGHVPLQRGQVAALDRDTSPVELERILAGATVEASTAIETDGQAYVARQYRLLTAVRQEWRTTMTPVCFSGGVGQTICTQQIRQVPVRVPVTAEFVVIQRSPSGALHAWGTLEALSKDPDPAVSDLMPALKAKLREAQATR